MADDIGVADRIAGAGCDLPACGGGLVSAARCPQLLLPYSLPAAVAAIALASITTRTDSEKRIARGIKAPPNAKALSRSICCHAAGHSQPQYAMDDRTDDWRLRRDDVARPRPKFRKLRFPVIANSLPRNTQHTAVTWGHFAVILTPFPTATV